MTNWRSVHVHNSGPGVVNVSSSNQHNYYCGDTQSVNVVHGRVFSVSVGGHDNVEHSTPRIETIDSSGDDSSFPSLARAGRPTNNLRISQTNFPLMGAYRIDPSLDIPAGLVSNSVVSRGPTSQRTNLRAESLNGSILMNVGLVMPQNDRPTSAQGPRKAVLSCSSQNGAIKVRIAPNTPRPPFRLVASCTNGGVTVFIPRSFHGRVTLNTTHGRIRVSREVKRRMTDLPNDGHKKKFFIGNPRSLNANSHTVDEGLDELSADSINGVISLFYAEEYADDEAATEGPVGSSYDEDGDDWQSGSFMEEISTDGVHTVNANLGSGVFNNIQGDSVNIFWS